MKFSQRIGQVPIQEVIQTNSMTTELRNSLWNCLDVFVWNSPGFQRRQHGEAGIFPFSANVWFHYFKKPIDTRSEYAFEIIAAMRSYFFDAQWYEVYDFLEFIVSLVDDKQLEEAINLILETELAGFTLIDKKFTPITDEIEVEALGKALEKGPFSEVETHLKQSLSHLSDRNNPDFRNSIKESISAVEAMARIITGDDKATLGKALAELEKNHNLHPALKRGFSSLYGYTNDGDGIRHAMIEASSVTASDAKYFLVACASFINYMKSKYAT